ncbi:hypothetical protein V8G54_019681 [Vigna mungo]|uniref:Uncharacterized protein n=1 Tax=Vigna mungo TaxID=3915 RepID=A0AAQ3NB09_VIGMU
MLNNLNGNYCGGFNSLFERFITSSNYNNFSLSFHFFFISLPSLYFTVNFSQFQKHLYLQIFRLFFFPPKFPTPFLLSKFRNHSSFLKSFSKSSHSLSSFLFFVLPFRSLRVFSFKLGFHKISSPTLLCNSRTAFRRHRFLHRLLL